MNTITTPIANACPILSIDLGKNKCVNCIYDGKTGQAGFIGDPP
jgi:hypothetical protein